MKTTLTSITRPIESGLSALRVIITILKTFLALQLIMETFVCGDLRTCFYEY